MWIARKYSEELTTKRGEPQRTQGSQRKRIRFQGTTAQTERLQVYASIAKAGHETQVNAFLSVPLSTVVKILVLPTGTGCHLLNHGQNELAVTVVEIGSVAADLAQEANFVIAELRQTF